MCGICGKLSLDGASIDKAFIQKMNQELHHRGPDDEGIYVDEHIGLGQKRLAIIDIDKSGTAPLSNEDESIWLVFNGEIYNYQILREELIGKGHIFKTHTDTEVIIHLYEEYGHDLLDHLTGMFAFVIWDRSNKTIFAARDRFGKKPFFYSKNQSGFLFGSEVKALTVQGGIEAEPNYKSLGVFLKYGYIPSPLSAFKGISKLQPGHYLTCSIQGNIEVHKYWEPSRHIAKDWSEEELKHEIRERVIESTKLRMISDVPLGAFLSGGIDSTTIVALMSQISSKQVKTFSIGFDDDQFNELPYARLLADKYNTEHHEFVVKPELAEILPSLVRSYNEPFADSSAIPTYYVSKMTREHVTVALSGDGGDEGFGGYSRYQSIAQWDMVSRKLPSFVRGGLRAGSRLVDSMPYSNMTARVSRALTMLGGDISAKYRLHMSAGLKPQERNLLFSDKFYALSKVDCESDPLCQLDLIKGYDAVNWMMLHDQSNYLPDELMVKTDIASMANSLEVRSPLLDHKLFELSSTIPVSMKIQNGVGKHIFRETFKDLLPHEILNKPKTGFAIPLAKWLRNDLKNILKKVLLSDVTAKRGLFQMSTVHKLVNEHLDGKRDWSNRLWTLLMFEMWFREFIDN